MRALLFLSLAAALSAPPTSAVQLQVENPYGELVDRGDTRVAVGATDNSRVDCAAGLDITRTGNRIVLVARRLPGTPVQGDCFTVGGSLGELAVGTYELEARLLAVDGGTFEAVTRSITIAATEGRCNADPELASIFAAPKRTSSGSFVDRVQSDPAYAAMLGNPVVRQQPAPYPQGVSVELLYPPLVDITAMLYRLDQTGEFASLSRNAWACGVPPPATTKKFVEFYHAGLDHYFYSGNEGEIEAIESGRIGGWTRTGQSFTGIESLPGCLRNNLYSAVYRFDGIPGKGPSSHFFTRDRTECHAVEKSGQWQFAGLPFYAVPPDAAGSCKDRGVALYRAWRPFGDSNHRFTTDRRVVDEMTAQGWIDEGVAMCVLAR